MAKLGKSGLATWRKSRSELETVDKYKPSCKVVGVTSVGFPDWGAYVRWFYSVSVPIVATACGTMVSAAAQQLCPNIYTPSPVRVKARKSYALFGSMWYIG